MKLTVNCTICGKLFAAEWKGAKCCSRGCSNKYKSEIYKTLHKFNNFNEIPQDALKWARSRDRNSILPRIKKLLPHLYEDFKKHWDNYKICKYCGDFFMRSSSGKRTLEVCNKPECKKYIANVNFTISKNRKETCLKKYGVDSYSKTPEFFETMKVKNPFYDYDYQKLLHTKIIESAGGVEAWKEKQRTNSLKFQNSLTKEEKEKIASKRELTK